MPVIPAPGPLRTAGPNLSKTPLLSRGWGPPRPSREKLERQVAEGLRTRVLTSENMEELVRITSEEMRSAAGKLKERLDVIKAELRGVKARLARLYGAPETGKLGLDDLSPESGSQELVLLSWKRPGPT